MLFAGFRHQPLSPIREWALRYRHFLALVMATFNITWPRYNIRSHGEVAIMSAVAVLPQLEEVDLDDSTLHQRVMNDLDDHLDLFRTIRDSLCAEVVALGRQLRTALDDGKKILIAGNGGSAADAQHFSAELIGRFVRERRALPAIALTTDTSILTAVGNDYGYDEVFARQVNGLGQPGDVFIGISTSGHSGNILRAIEEASAQGMRTIGLAGRDGGQLRNQVDHALIVPHQATARIQEVHEWVLHTWCDLIDELSSDA